MTSHLRRASGPRNPWTAEPGVVVDLPVTLDFVIAEQATGVPVSVTRATVDLRGGQPVLVRLTVDTPGGIDIPWTQREFRWAGPVEVVTRMVPALIRAGRDPFAAEYPISDLPAVTRPAAARKLSAEFLEDIAREYLTLGPGYARKLAGQYQVSPRTVVSWVEKARRRGILSQTRPGSFGGHLSPGGERAKDNIPGRV